MPQKQQDRLHEPHNEQKNILSCHNGTFQSGWGYLLVKKSTTQHARLSMPDPDVHSSFPVIISKGSISRSSHAERHGPSANCVSLSIKKQINGCLHLGPQQCVNTCSLTAAFLLHIENLPSSAATMLILWFTWAVQHTAALPVKQWGWKIIEFPQATNGEILFIRYRLIDYCM